MSDDLYFHPGRFSSVGDQVVRIYFHGMEKDGLIDLRQDSQGVR